MRKHPAAVLSGVGSRLDESPELLLVLRGVDQKELIAAEPALTRYNSGRWRTRTVRDAGRSGNNSRSLNALEPAESNALPHGPDRLPRGRTCVRNGSVCHLAIEPGGVEALGAGRDFDHVVIRIKRLRRPARKAIKSALSTSVGKRAVCPSGHTARHDQRRVMTSDRRRDGGGRGPARRLPFHNQRLARKASSEESALNRCVR